MTNVVGTLTLEENLPGGGRVGWEMLTFCWTFDAINGDYMESPTVTRIAAFETPSTRAEVWKMVARKLKDGRTYEMMLCEDPQNSLVKFRVVEIRMSKDYRPDAGIALSRKYQFIHFLHETFRIDVEPTTGGRFALTVCVMLNSRIEPENIRKTVAYDRVAGLFTDFVLVASDGVEVKAHRVQLAAASRVFKEILLHDARISETGRAVVNGVDGKTLNFLVTWMYGNRLMLENRYGLHQLRRFYDVAHRFHVEALMAEVKEQMMAAVRGVEEYAEQYIFAKQFGLPDVVDQVVGVIAKNRANFERSGGFQVITDMGKEVLSTFMAELCDKLYDSMA